MCIVMYQLQSQRSTAATVGVHINVLNVHVIDRMKYPCSEKHCKHLHM